MEHFDRLDKELDAFEKEITNLSKISELTGSVSKLATSMKEQSKTCNEGIQELKDEREKLEALRNQINEQSASVRDLAKKEKAERDGFADYIRETLTDNKDELIGSADKLSESITKSSENNKTELIKAINDMSVAIVKAETDNNSQMKLAVEQMAGEIPQRLEKKSDTDKQKILSNISESEEVIKKKMSALVTEQNVDITNHIKSASADINDILAQVIARVDCVNASVERTDGSNSVRYDEIKKSIADNKQEIMGMLTVVAGEVKKTQLLASAAIVLSIVAMVVSIVFR